MQSSKFDPTATLEAIAAAYEQAVECAIAGNLDTVAKLLDDNDERLARELDEPTSPQDRDAAHARAVQAHQKLISLLGSMQGSTHDDLRKNRDGQRAMKGYNARGKQVGERVQSRA